MYANLLDCDLPLACESRQVCNQCALIKNNSHHFSIPLCADRSSTYLPISVCSTGSEEPQQGENVKLNQDMLLLLIETCDGIFIYFFLLLSVVIFNHPPNPYFLSPAHARALQSRRSSHTNISTQQSEPSSQGNRTRRRRRSHRQTPPSSQTQTPVQQILNPANLLRRLLPSSSRFSSDANAS